MNITLQPKYKLDQDVKMISMGIPLIVKITNRTAVIDIDNGIISYKYDLKHEIPNGWVFDSVPEATLDEYN